MPITTSVDGLQEVLAELDRVLAKFSDSGALTVGIHEDTGVHPPPENNNDSNAGKNNKDPITNARLGAVLHFGTQDGRIPARPWLDVSVEESQAEIIDILEEGIANELTLQETLEQVGPVVAANVQQYMVNLREPPNAPSTIRQKGSDNPLVNTNILIGSVSYKNVLDLPEEGL